MQPPSDVTFRFGEFQLNTERRELIGPDGVVDIQPKVYDFLLYLLQRNGAVVTKDELLREVWPDVIVTESVLTRAARAARKALGDDASNPKYIRAQHGVGYRFIAAVAQDGDTAEGGDVPTLAIFPFQMLPATARDEVLEFGLADTLVTRLSKLRDLAVRSLTSAATALDMMDGAGPLQAARTLEVDYFLEATLQIHDKTLRVNARLVSTQDGAATWSDSFNERFEDIFEFQDVICEQIASRIVPHVSEQGTTDDTNVPVAPDAYRAFMEGRLFAGRYTHPGSLKAIEHFERALDIAPDYAEAWAALGECHELLAIEGEQSAPERYAAARSASKRALALSPDLPDAQCVLAKVAWQHDWNWHHAEAILQRVLRQYPNRADFRVHYVSFLCSVGRGEEAIEHGQRSVSIDPTSPWCHTMLAQALHMSRRFEEAWKQADWTLQLAPNFAFARLFSAMAHYCAGNAETAMEHIREGIATGRLDFLSMLGYLAGMTGDAEQAEEVLTNLKENPTTGPFSLAVASLGCEQFADATQFFQECVERRDWHVFLVCYDPAFELYRKHKQYKSLNATIESQVSKAAR